MLIQITAPHFCAGITVENGYVERTAPIVRYMCKWTPARVLSYCAHKRWKAVSVNEK